jgi:hypothetical protein
MQDQKDRIRSMNRLIAAIAVFLCAPGTAFADDVAEASIRGNEFRAGGQVEFDGHVNRSAFLSGGDVTVSGEVGRNLYVAGGTLRIEPQARVTGDATLAGGRSPWTAASAAISARSASASW